MVPAERLTMENTPSAPPIPNEQPQPMSMGEFVNQTGNDLPPQRQPLSPDEVRDGVQKLTNAIEDYKVTKGEPTEKKRDEAQQDELEKDSDDKFWSWEESDVLANSDRRKRIEKSLKPLRVEDLLMHGEVRQTVSIISSKFEPTFRSISADEEMALQRMMWGVSGSDLYLQNRYSTMLLTAGLFAVNGNLLPDHRAGETPIFSEDLFNEKLKKVLRYPKAQKDDLVINYGWFDDRVRRLFAEEDLGNG